MRWANTEGRSEEEHLTPNLVTFSKTPRNADHPFEPHFSLLSTV